jgi:transporter family protein
MAAWFWYAVVAAVLYGAHQIFTRIAADHIGEGLGGFVVEATAALSILLYLAFLWLASRWNQQSSNQGIFYSVLTGICVGAGTIAFFLLFQKGGPLSAVPAILAGGAAIMAIAAAKAGKMVLCEKPLSMNTKEGQKMVAAVEMSGNLVIGNLLDPRMPTEPIQDSSIG